MVQSALYDVLGVPVRVDPDTLKKAYRKLAKLLHPDQNKGDPSAELRFKEVNQAYAVLSDARRRALYDEFGDASLRPTFDPARARARARSRADAIAVRTVGVSQPMPGAQNGLDILNNLFRRRRARAVRGADLEAELTIDFADAVRGVTRRLELSTGAIVEAKIPRGVADGAIVRIVNAGAPSLGDAPSGDLVLRVRVRAHPHFKREKNDLHLALPITLREAYFGATVKIPAPTGAISVKVPRLSQSGLVLRVREKGVAPEGETPGDLLVTILVLAPAAESLEVARAVEVIAAAQLGDPREHIKL